MGSILDLTFHFSKPDFMMWGEREAEEVRMSQDFGLDNENAEVNGLRWGSRWVE